MTGLVTVFGGTGFVGTQVVRALAKAGWRIRVAVRHPRRGFNLLPFGDVGQIQLFRADVTKPASVEAALQGATAVVNLVGILHQTLGRSFRRVHVEGTQTIAEAAAKLGIQRLVQVSAIGADTHGHALYARTKGVAEDLTRRAVPTATILRPSVVFGPEDDFFNRFAQMATISPALPLIGGGKTRFQPVYVGDVALAVAHALKLPLDEAAGVFELGGPDVHTFKALMQIVLRETHRKALLAPIPFPVADLLGLLGDLQAMAFLPPVVTSDQVRLLRSDNVVSPGARGLAALAIQPTAVETIVPTYLWRYRRGGQFAELAEV
jgi:NADH dehydrogenase